MRCLTANYLEAHRDYFEQFCQIPYAQLIQEVLTMGKEADGLGVGPLQVVLQIKVETVTIDKNHDKILFFDQMQVSGLCPMIYILYKPGHYDIIYLKEQSDVDGFVESSQNYSAFKKIPFDYNLESPDCPFFKQIDKHQDQNPFEESKRFVIKCKLCYTNTKENWKQHNDQQIKKEFQAKFQYKTCQKCGYEVESQNVILTNCNHQLCFVCLLDLLKNNLKFKFTSMFYQQNFALKCLICNIKLKQTEKKLVLQKLEEEKLKETKNKECLIF